MSAVLRVIDSDGATVILSLNEGTIATSGLFGPKLLYLENYGDQSCDSLTIALQAVAANDGINYPQIAPDSGGTPGSWTTGSLAVGSLAALARYPFWVKTGLPAGLTGDANPRRFNIVVNGSSV